VLRSWTVQSSEENSRSTWLEEQSGCCRRAGHGLPAAVDDLRLGKGRISVADLRAAAAVEPAIDQVS
jgi:hypothetical protein